MNHSKYSIKYFRGSAVLEFALVLPVMFAIIYGCLEISNRLNQEQVANTFSYESANTAFRVCAGQGAGAQSSLDIHHPTFQHFAQGRLNQAEVILSIFDYIPAGGGQPERVQLRAIKGVSTITGQSALGRKSKFTPPDQIVMGVPVVNLFRSIPLTNFPTQAISSANRTIAISELYYTPTILGLRTKFFAGLAAGLEYEVTIF